MPKNHRNYQKTRHIALSGLLFALAMALSFCATKQYTQLEE